MTLSEIIATGIDPALALLPASMDTPEARIMLLAIGLQESHFEHRRQLVGNPPGPSGPAKSLWQAEQGGGLVRGLRLHAVTSAAAARARFTSILAPKSRRLRRTCDAKS